MTTTKNPCFHLSIVQCQDVATNIVLNTLGLGYDALKGDPHTSNRDPGMKRPVFQLKNKTDFTVSPLRFLNKTNIL